MNMASQAVKLLDPSGNLLAIATVACEGPCYAGSVDLGSTPAGLRALFQEFEETVNGQEFSFLDGIQRKIAALSIKVSFEDGTESPVEDLQVFPGTGDISFRLVPTCSAVNGPLTR